MSMSKWIEDEGNIFRRWVVRVPLPVIQGEGEIRKGGFE